MDKFEMHRASEEGYLERMRQLMEWGMSVDSRDDEGRTPLHYAAVKGRYEVVDFLSSLPECDLNLKDQDNGTPVLLAAQSKETTVVGLLLQRGAQVNCVHHDQWTLLHYASFYGWTDHVHSILDRGEADLNAATWCGDTPLILAAKEGQEDVAVLLIQAGADVCPSDPCKWTALVWAAFNRLTRVVQELLEREGLDINLQDDYGDTPLHWACYRGHREVVMQLLVAGVDTTLKNTVGDTALSGGIERGKLTLEDVRLFVQKGAFLQECDYVRISRNQVLKESVLKDVGLCTQSIVNKFHRQSLPALNRISYFARKLPNIDKLKLKARQVDIVGNFVECEIKRNTFCNVVKAHPMALSALCVLSLITCQSGTKRSASPDLSDSNSPFKKLHA